MAIVTALCESYKMELLMGLHAITDDYRMALFVNGAKLSASTTRYSSEMEAVGENYKSGGIAIPNMRVESNGPEFYIDFDPVVYERLTVAVDGCLIYNASKENRAVAVFNFGETLLARNGKIEVESPSTGVRGIVRLK
jgi:hypothetical protein